jgi:hypothetical protein
LNYLTDRLRPRFASPAYYTPYVAVHRPRDFNQLAYQVMLESTGQAPKVDPHAGERTKNPAAVALGRLGGLKGGSARAAALSTRKRRTIAKKGAAVRWGKKSAK